MAISSGDLIVAMIVGLGASFFMDAWAWLLQRVFQIAAPNYCLVGRWLCYMPTGIFTHSNIIATPKKSAECVTGWLVHYLTGISYALLLVMATSGNWLAKPSLLPALLVGIGTVLIPYFIMQPAFGMGVAAAKTVKPMQARLKSLMAHTVFGVGMFVSALLLRYVSGG